MTGGRLLHINEFTVDSDIAFPCDAGSLPAFGYRPADPLVIRRRSLRDVPCLLRRFKRQISYDVGDGLLVVPNELMLHVNNAGDTILVDVEERHLPVAPMWLIHAGLAVCTLLRGGVPLHAAGVEVNGRFLGIMAPSGAGKSTLVCALLRQGARFGNDDVLPVHLVGGRAVATPSVSLYPKLRRETLEHYAVHGDGLMDAPPEPGEVWMPVARRQRVRRQHPLGALILLQPSSDGQPDAPPTLHLLEANAAADAIKGHLNGVWVLGDYFDLGPVTAICEALARSVPVYALRYAKRFDTLPEVVRVLVDHAATVPNWLAMPKDETPMLSGPSGSIA